MKRIAFLLCLTVTLYACAAGLEATWKTVPETNISPARAWTIVVNTVSESFELETIDGQSGYLKSGWKTTDTCWGGLVSGGMIPCEKSRVIVRVEDRIPFKVKVKVEKQTANPWTSYSVWAPNGNNERLEREIMETLQGRLKKI